MKNLILFGALFLSSSLSFALDRYSLDQNLTRSVFVGVDFNAAFDVGTDIKTLTINNELGSIILMPSLGGDLEVTSVSHGKYSARLSFEKTAAANAELTVLYSSETDKENIGAFLDITDSKIRWSVANPEAVDLKIKVPQGVFNTLRVNSYQGAIALVNLKNNKQLQVQTNNAFGATSMVRSEVRKFSLGSTFGAVLALLVDSIGDSTIATSSGGIASMLNSGDLSITSDSGGIAVTGHLAGKVSAVSKKGKVEIR